MSFKQLLVIFYQLMLVFSRIIYFENYINENIIVSITGIDEFIIGADEVVPIDVHTGNITIYAKYAFCKINACDEYVTKAQFTIGYIAENLDLKYIDLRSGYNFYMKIKPTYGECEISETACSKMLTVCPESTMVLADKKMVACKNTKESYLQFLDKCGKTVISDMYVGEYTQKCVNVYYYTITFGKL